MSDNQEWYYAEGSSSVGPVSQTEFDALVANGTIRFDTLVWQDGMSDWMPLGHLEGAPTPPPVAAMGSTAGSTARADASTFVGALKDGMSRYVEFSTRSNRPQFWWWTLWTLILGFVSAIVDAMLGMDEGGIFNLLVNLVLFLPSLAVAIRRLHDIGRSGWWYLLIFIPIVGWIILIVFFCTRSADQPNQWGPVPH